MSGVYGALSISMACLRGHEGSVYLDGLEDVGTHDACGKDFGYHSC
jgi:hypothetical protein